MRWRAPRIWEGGEAWILGGGASAPRQLGVPEDVIDAVTSGKRRPAALSSYYEPLHNRHVIGVNNAYQIGSWVDAVFFGDCSWYLVHRRELARAFPGLKISCCPRFANKRKEDSEGIKFLQKDSEHRIGISTNPTKVAWNNNSGAAAINVAVHFGAKRIRLLGFDMTLDKKGVSHWHGSHGNKTKKPPFGRHLKGFPLIAREARKLGVEILNVSPISIIKEFKKVKLERLL